MKTKEEILSARIGTYGFTKLELSKPIICPIEALDAMQEYSDQNTKPLIEKISSLEASLLDVTRKSCARVDELKDEIADLKSQLLISEQKVKLNYNCAIESSKSEASDAVTWDSIYIEYMNECPNWKDEKCMSITEWLKLNYNIPTRNNK